MAKGKGEIKLVNESRNNMNIIPLNFHYNTLAYKTPGDDLMDGRLKFCRALFTSLENHCLSQSTTGLK